MDGQSLEKYSTCARTAKNCLQVPSRKADVSLDHAMKRGGPLDARHTKGQCLQIEITANDNAFGPVDGSKNFLQGLRNEELR